MLEKAAAVHPLAPLGCSEITTCAHLVMDKYPQGTNLQFKAITLLEPKKEDAIPYLAAERGRERLPHIARKAFVAYYIRNTVTLARCIEHGLSKPILGLVYCSACAVGDSSANMWGP
jgi:primary-amine oxidase